MVHRGFREIAEALREAIRTGTFRRGEMLPSEANLCAVHGTSRTTLRRGLMLLAEEGLVEAMPGRGWVVCPRPAAMPPRVPPVSLTDQLAAHLRHAIASGEWAKGDKLPGELTLAQTYGVGRITVRRAIALLVDEGLLSTRMGVGSTVVGP